ASLGNLGRTTFSSFSGSLVDWLDASAFANMFPAINSWSVFFVITTLMVIPSLLMIWSLRGHFARLTEHE
ncbi:MAG: AmpG family muropeptide MFS transporter, partial [Vibrionaceae bacterium]